MLRRGYSRLSVVPYARSGLRVHPPARTAVARRLSTTLSLCSTRGAAVARPYATTPWRATARERACTLTPPVAPPPSASAAPRGEQGAAEAPWAPLLRAAGLLHSEPVPVGFDVADEWRGSPQRGPELEQQEARENEEKTLDDDGHGRIDGLVAWWESSYGSLFDDSTPDAASTRRLQESVWDDRLPDEGSDTALLVQALAIDIVTLRSVSLSRRKTDGCPSSRAPACGTPSHSPPAARETEIATRVLTAALEMEAVMLYLVHERLRYYTLDLTTLSASAAPAQEVQFTRDGAPARGQRERNHNEDDDVDDDDARGERIHPPRSSRLRARSSHRSRHDDFRRSSFSCSSSSSWSYSAAPVPPDASASLMDPSKSLPSPLQRGLRERAREMAPPMDAAALLQITVLIDTVQSVLQVQRTSLGAANTVPRLFAAAGGVQDGEVGEAAGVDERATAAAAVPFTEKEWTCGTMAALYGLLITALGGAEQLPGAVLATLADGLARTAEGYSTAMQLTQHRRAGDGEDDLSPSVFSSFSAANSRPASPAHQQDSLRAAAKGCGVAASCLRSPQYFCRRLVRTRGGASPVAVQPSAEECEERQQLRVVFGDENAAATATPTGVIVRFQALAAALQPRLEAELRRALQQELQGDDWKERTARRSAVGSLDETPSSFVQLLRDAENASALSSTSIVRQPQLRHALVERVLAESRVQQGALGLKSLADRKRTEQQQQQQRGACCQTNQRKRQTIGRINEAVVSATAPLSNGCRACRTALEVFSEDGDAAAAAAAAYAVTLRDVADVATALASQRCRVDEAGTFWSCVAHYACWAAYSWRQGQQQQLENMREEMSSAESSTSVNATVQTELCVDPVAAGEASLLRELRDIAFALDHVQQSASYDLLMAVLVQLQLLAQPVPPPSSRQQSMRAVKTPAAG